MLSLAVKQHLIFLSTLPVRRVSSASAARAVIK